MRGGRSLRHKRQMLAISRRKRFCYACSSTRYAGAFGPGRKHSLLPALAKNMPPAYFLNASRPPGRGLGYSATSSADGKKAPSPEGDGILSVILSEAV